MADFLKVRAYGEREDKEMNGKTKNVERSSKQNFINLFEPFFADFMGRGHIATINPAYMGKLATQVGQEVWKLNMVGTSQVNQTGARDKVKAQQKKMKVGTYESCFFNTTVYHFMLLCGLTTT